MRIIWIFIFRLMIPLFLFLLSFFHFNNSCDLWFVFVLPSLLMEWASVWDKQLTILWFFCLMYWLSFTVRLMLWYTISCQTENEHQLLTLVIKIMKALSADKLIWSSFHDHGHHPEETTANSWKPASHHSFSHL